MFRSILFSIFGTAVIVMLSMAGIGGSIPAANSSVIEPTTGAETTVPVQVVNTAEPTLVSVDSVPVVPAINNVVLLPSNPISMSGLYDMQHFASYDANHNVINLQKLPMDVDPRLDAILNPTMVAIIWDPSDSESFDNNGVRFIKVYHTKSADEINSMNPADRVPYTIFVDESHVVTQSNSNTENIFKSYFRMPEVRSFALLGQVSKSVYQIQITFMAISDPKAADHDLIINGHVVHYVDILVYIPGKGLVKQGLATGVDDQYNSMFRGTAVYTHTSKTDNYLGVYSIPTKIIFEDDNVNNYNTAFTAEKWFMSTDMFGQQMQSFATHSGDTLYNNMRVGNESIKYLPFLPSNYYADFLKSGGQSFVVFFAGDDINGGSSDMISVFEKPFSAEDISVIRSEWDESGNWVK